MSMSRLTIVSLFAVSLSWFSSPVMVSAQAPRTGAPRTGAPRTAPAPGRATVNPRQPAGQAGPANAPTRPAVQPLRVKRTDPRLEVILQEWEEKSSRVERLEGSFAKFTYDDTFMVEKRATGKFCYEHPDRGSFLQTGTDPGNGISKKVDTKTGKPYALTKDADQRWVCDGEHVFLINEDEKTYEETTIPPDVRGKNIMNSPLPFVFGMKAEQAKLRYDMELSEKTNNAQVWLTVTPLWREDQVNWRKAEVILDRNTYLPLAVRLTSPTGESQSTYSFDMKSVVINAKTWKQWLTGQDPLKPDLGRYQKIVAPGGNADALPPQQGRQERPIQVAPRPTDRRSATLPGTGVPLQRTATVPPESRNRR